MCISPQPLLHSLFVPGWLALLCFITALAAPALVIIGTIKLLAVYYERKERSSKSKDG
jgi:hypothetical protein